MSRLRCTAAAEGTVTEEGVCRRAFQEGFSGGLFGTALQRRGRGPATPPAPEGSRPPRCCYGSAGGGSQSERGRINLSLLPTAAGQWEAAVAAGTAPRGAGGGGRAGRAGSSSRGSCGRCEPGVFAPCRDARIHSRPGVDGNKQ